MSASIFVHRSSCTWTLAQRFHSSALRSSSSRGCDRGPHRLQPHREVLAVLRRGQRAHRADGELDVLDDRVGVLERQRFSAAARVSSACTAPCSRCRLSSWLRLPGGAHVLLARLEGRGHGREPLGQRRIDLADPADRLPLAPQRLPLAAHRGVVGGDEPLGLFDDRRRLGGELRAPARAARGDVRPRAPHRRSGAARRRPSARPSAAGLPTRRAPWPARSARRRRPGPRRARTGPAARPAPGAAPRHGGPRRRGGLRRRPRRCGRDPTAFRTPRRLPGCTSASASSSTHATRAAA